MQEIRNWLNGPANYQEGVKLYSEFGQDPILRRSFSEAESEYKRRRLRVALQDLLIHVHNQEAPATLKGVEVVESYKYWPPVPIADRILAALHERWKPIYAEMMSMQSRVYEVALLGEIDGSKKLEACQLAHKILDLDDACQRIYDQRDYYYKHSRLSTEEAEPAEVVGDPIRWVTLMKNAQRYARDFKKKLLKEPGNLKVAATLKKHEGVAAHYKSLLKL